MNNNIKLAIIAAYCRGHTDINKQYYSSGTVREYYGTDNNLMIY